MKKNILIIFLSMLIILYPINTYAIETTPFKAAILIDCKTGKVLYQNNKDKILPEASITKLMTYYVVKDYLKSSKINEKTIINIDTDNFEMQDDASGIGLIKGQKMSISDLISSMLIASASDSAEALKAYYEKSGNSFIDAMNNKAAEVGLKNTRFVNPTGLTIDGTPTKLNTTTAYDIALLSKYIINDYPEILLITSKKSIVIGGKSYTNTNGALIKNDIVDGLKTGYTKQAGYCLALTANIKGNSIKSNSFLNAGITEDMRLISVVLGCDEEELRVKESLYLLDYGKANFANELILSKNDKFKMINELYGNGYIEACPGKELFLLKNKNEKLERVVIINKKLPYKIKKGDLIGTVEIKDKNDILINTSDLYASDDYKKINIFKRFYIFIKRIAAELKLTTFQKGSPPSSLGAQL